MFSRIVAVVVQTIFFILVFAVGSFLPAISPVPMWRVLISSAHYFVLDGPILAFAIFLLILVIEALLKRFRTSALLTTISFVLAFGIALLAKLPFMDRATV